MATRNDITGDKIQSKVPSQAYKDNYDRIFGKSKDIGPGEDECQHSEKPQDNA